MAQARGDRRGPVTRKFNSKRFDHLCMYNMSQVNVYAMFTYYNPGANDVYLECGVGPGCIGGKALGLTLADPDLVTKVELWLAPDYDPENYVLHASVKAEDDQWLTAVRFVYWHPAGQFPPYNPTVTLEAVQGDGLVGMADRYTLAGDYMPPN